MPTKILNNIAKINLSTMIEGLIGRDDYKEFIIKQNQERLLKSGTDVEGEKLQTYNATGGNAYSDLTMNIKRHNGQTNKHVTIHDTGEAYSTMKTETDDKGFAVSMKDEKDEGKISDNLDLESALGLADLQPLIEKLIPDLQTELLQQLRA